MAVSMGFHWWQAVIISMVTVTSAGQLAGIGIMVNPGQYIEMLISQLTVNVRYSFMAISLSQKTDSKFKGIYRWLLGFFITDEIFAVASNEESVSRSFFTGLSLIPWLGWTMGTLTGALLGNILPDELMSALCIAIYGMFVAIIAPKAKKSLSLLIVVVIALAMSCIFYYAPVLKEISSGISISVCAILAALIGAIFFPVKEDADNG
ncbi:MAG: AzlC family ABC transporter permease [Ruminiclostridium sp.]|nr:AzlC family ABC transporter permease [Ruminiclostridium sp.]